MLRIFMVFVAPCRTEQMFVCWTISDVNSFAITSKSPGQFVVAIQWCNMNQIMIDYLKIFQMS